MSHPVPNNFKGEERIFSIPYLNVHISKKGVVYNGIASLVAVAVFKATGGYIAFAVTFLMLNIAVYPFGHSRTNSRRFDGGNVPRDVYIYRKFLYKFNKNIYIRDRKKVFK